MLIYRWYYNVITAFPLKGILFFVFASYHHYVLRRHFRMNHKTLQPCFIVSHEIKALPNNYIIGSNIWTSSYYVLLTHLRPQTSFVRHDLFLSSPFLYRKAFVCHTEPRQRFSNFPVPNRRIIGAATPRLFLLMSCYYPYGVFTNWILFRWEKGWIFIGIGILFLLLWMAIRSLS